MIRISAKGLAKYMTSGDASKRKILRDYKFPDPEGAVQAKYYAEARRVIEEYHNSGNDVSTIVSAVDKLNASAARETGRKHDRLRNNIRALESYLSNFGKEKLQILPTPNMKFSHGQVLVSAYPDLYVKDGNRYKIIKLDLGKDNPKPNMIRIVLQVTYAAAQEAQLPVLPGDVIYVEVERGTQHKGVTKRDRLQRDIEAACQTIEDVWPKLS